MELIISRNFDDFLRSNREFLQQRTTSLVLLGHRIIHHLKTAKTRGYWIKRPSVVVRNRIPILILLLTIFLLLLKEILTSGVRKSKRLCRLTNLLMLKKNG